MIYFDNSATSLIKPQRVKNAVKDAIDFYTANPGRSGHNESVKVAEKIFNIREKVKDFLGAKSYDLIFTKNCTEALNLAIFGTLKPGDNVIASCYEHNSVLRPLFLLEKMGVEVTIIDCDLAEFHSRLEEQIKSNTKMIICTMISNVTGEESEVKSIANICKKYDLIFLVDGAQACGHKKIDIEEIGADMFAFAGHKGLLSVSGVGGLIVKDIKKLNPILYGGTGVDSFSMEQKNDLLENFEAGTLPSLPIISLGAGVNFLKENFQKILKIEEKLINYAYFQLKNLDFVEIYSNFNTKNVIAFNVKNCDSSDVASFLNQKNICVRAGLHCAPLVHKKYKTLKIGMIRISLDYHNTKQEIDYLIKVLKEFYYLNLG